jgi:hypothetical protein
MPWSWWLWITLAPASRHRQAVSAMLSGVIRSLGDAPTDKEAWSRIFTDFNKRAAIYSELNQMIYEDAPFIILSILNNRSYEQLYMNGWLGGTSQNPLVSLPGTVNELSKDNQAK